MTDLLPSTQEAGAEEISSEPSWSTWQDLVNGKRGERGKDGGEGGVVMLKLKTTLLAISTKKTDTDLSSKFIWGGGVIDAKKQNRE